MSNASVRLSNPWHCLALGFGSGLAPIAPGTAGSLAALPLCFALLNLAWGWQVMLLLLGFVVGIKACQVTTDALGVPDHGSIVWDEFIGMGITLCATPPSLLWCGVGFVLFRFFDILKPWPIRFFDRTVHGGLGIMLDDVLAGLAAFGMLQGLRYAVG